MKNAFLDERLSGNSSCEPIDDVPDAGWSRKRLYDRAVWENERIEHCETHAPLYWSFGKVLLLVRRDFTLQQWKAWRQARSLDRTRCDRAMLLARALKSPAEIKEMPLLAALALACERLGASKRLSTADNKLRRSLTAIEKSLQQRLDETRQLTNVDGVRVRIAQARRLLNELDAACAVLERRSAAPARKRRKKPR